jgi:hypothetical protein
MAGRLSTGRLSLCRMACSNVFRVLRRQLKRARRALWALLPGAGEVLEVRLLLLLCLAQLVLHVFFAAVLITAGVQTHEGVLNECYVATVSLIFKVGGVVLVVSAVKQDNRHALMLGNLVELYLSIAPLASNSYYVDRIDHLSIKIASDASLLLVALVSLAVGLLLQPLMIRTYFELKWRQRMSELCHQSLRARRLLAAHGVLFKLDMVFSLTALPSLVLFAIHCVPPAPPAGPVALCRATL